MPIRTATPSTKIAANGQALHRAMQRRIASASASAAPSEAEAALIEERRQLKEERVTRREQASRPRPTALDRLVRTHHPEAKGGKVRKADGGETKKPKPRMSRAQKHTEKAAALEAARRSPKKPAAK